MCERERWESDREVMSKENTCGFCTFENEQINMSKKKKKSVCINEKTRIVHNSQKSDARRYKIAKHRGKKNRIEYVDHSQVNAFTFV